MFISSPSVNVSIRSHSQSVGTRREDQDDDPKRARWAWENRVCITTRVLEF